MKKKMKMLMMITMKMMTVIAIKMMVMITNNQDGLTSLTFGEKAIAKVPMQQQSIYQFICSQFSRIKLNSVVVAEVDFGLVVAASESMMTTNK